MLPSKIMKIRRVVQSFPAKSFPVNSLASREPNSTSHMLLIYDKIYTISNQVDWFDFCSVQTIALASFGPDNSQFTQTLIPGIVLIIVALYFSNPLFLIPE